MSETKRVTLNTLEPQKVSEKVSKRALKTIRISVSLPESNEDKCPEYNYKDELAAVKKKCKQIKNTDNVENGLDPFVGEDDDVRKIALEMEEKYGKKKRKGRKDDYADIGMGYDESDSFIDNTDGYDEIIPQNVTTLHGGFYINCGALEFKTDDDASSDFSSSSDDSDTNEKTVNKSNRKRILETSDEDEEDSTTNKLHADKKTKVQCPKNSLQLALKKKLFSANKIQVKKRRLIDPLKKTVKELLREKREDLNMTVPTELETVTIPPENGDAPSENPLKNVSSVTDTIESVVKATVDGSSKVDYDSNGNQHHVDVNSKELVAGSKNVVVDPPSSLEGESSRESLKFESLEIVKLPENLSADITKIIDNIKQAAANNKEGKVRFFTDEVNAMLLKLERNCKCLGKPSKMKVYEHLSPFVKCRKETLIRRAKNLVLEDEEKRLKKLLVSLKEGIDKVMPQLVTSYEAESQKILQMKFSRENVDNEENKALRMPKRRFLWAEDTKKCMKDILFTKKRCFLLEGKQKDTYDDQLMLFLKSYVQPLWPEGWISIAALKKLCTNLSESKTPENNKHSSNNLAQNKSNLSIIPIASNASKVNNVKVNHVANDITVSKVQNHIPPSQNKVLPSEVSSVAKDLSSSFNIQKLIEDSAVQKLLPAIDNTVIVVNKSVKEEVKIPILEETVKESNNSVIEASHCQVIDLTDSEAPRKKPKSKPRALEEHSAVVKEVLSSSKVLEIGAEPPRRKPGPKSKTRYLDPVPVENFVQHFKKADFFGDQQPNFNKHPELSVTPSFYTSSPGLVSEGDDIQQVMENLKALQKLSSPIKSDNSTSSPVSVIAYNKNFSPKSNSSQSSTTAGAAAPPRTEFSNNSKASQSNCRQQNWF